jgi:hypothetical protein
MSFPPAASALADLAQAIQDVNGSSKAASLGRATVTVQAVTSATRETVASLAVHGATARTFWSLFVSKSGVDLLLEVLDTCKTPEVEVAVLECLSAAMALVAVDVDVAAALRGWIPATPPHPLHALAILSDLSDDFGTCGLPV